MKKWILESGYQRDFPSIAGYGDETYNEGPAVVMSRLSAPVEWIDIEESGPSGLVSNSEGAKEYNKIVQGYRLEDWFTREVSGNPNISEILGDFHMAAVISGFCRDKTQSERARTRFEEMMGPFFPEEGRETVAQTLSSLTANFAALANSRSVAVRLSAGRPAFPPSGLSLDFHVAGDDALRGFYALRDIGPMVAPVESYDLHTFNRILADRLDGSTADMMEKKSYPLPQGSIGYWRGLGSFFPAVIAEPRRKAGEFYLSMEMKAVGDELAHSHEPKFRERMKDRSETYYLHPLESVLA